MPQVVARVERAIGNFFDEVGQLEMHLLVVFQGQRVAFAAQFDDENCLRCAALNLEAKCQGFTLGCRPQYVIEGLTKVDLGVKQQQGAIIEFELIHAA